MSEPFLAEIKIVGWDFAARGWAQCDGQILPINQNQSLYSLLGTMYGGDGEVTFALPDLRGRVAMHVTNGFSQGSRGGAENHVLQPGEIPSHTHSLVVTTADADSGDATGRFAAHAEVETYSESGQALMAGSALAPTGGGVGHNNMQPFLSLNFQIALTGLFPSPN